jgi:predicted NBD/HSP70 family sugar kinase
MASASPQNNGQSAQVEDVCRRIFRHLLQHGESCRQQISAEIGLSPASATNYCRWLSASGYLQSRAVKGATSKRPVEWMRLNPGKLVSVAVAITSKLVRADLIAADGSSIWHQEKTLENRCQHELMQAMEAVVAGALARAAKLDHRCDFAGVSVLGTIGYGIIFSFDGIKDWRPCTPTDLLPAFEQIEAAEVWTRIQCKMVGFAHPRRPNESLGYFQWDGSRLRMASMRNGVVVDGRNGTVSARLHQPVKRQGRVCYCGRKGCFVALLEHGEALQEHVTGVIDHITHEDEMKEAAIEWRGEGEPQQEVSKGSTKLVHVERNEDFAGIGLRLLCAEEALLDAVKRERGQNSAAGESDPGAMNELIASPRF